MGYIKKLKSNELVGGTDKTTIYPVTSTEAVFEEVSDNEFKSQTYLNNHITNERIVDNTIENRKLKDDTIDMGKLNTQLKTIIQNAYDASWKVKEEPFSLETKYDANDVVYDPDTNSSYVSLTADNQGNPVRLEDEEEVNPYWRLVINGISAVQATEEIEETKEELIDYIQGNLKDQVDDEIADAESRVAAAEQYAQGVIAEAEQTARSISGIVYQTVAATPNYTDTIPVQNKAVTAQIGYYTCSGGSGATIIVDDTDAAAFTPVKGGHIKILMTQKSAVTSGNVQLQFGSVTATKKVLLYNEEAVSSSNTWELGEVISVYYDGTKYHASNAQGGSSKKINAYLYEDLRTLAVGQTYEVNDAVKTTDKQLRMMTKNIGTLNLTDTIIAGDLKINGSSTYRALKTVGIFNSSTSYNSGDYAIGSYATYTFDVAAGTTAGNITFNGTEIAITEDESADDIAAAIVSSVAIDGWTLSANENTVTVKCNTIGNNTTSITFADTDNTGVSISTPTLTAGTDVVRVYNGSAWSSITLANYTADTTMWDSVDAAWLVTNATQQNSTTRDISKNISELCLNNPMCTYDSVGTNTSTYTERRIDVKKGRIRIKMNGSISRASGLQDAQSYIRIMLYNSAGVEQKRIFEATTVEIASPAEYYTFTPTLTSFDISTKVNNDGYILIGERISTASIYSIGVYGNDNDENLANVGFWNITGGNEGAYAISEGIPVKAGVNTHISLEGEMSKSSGLTDSQVYLRVQFVDSNGTEYDLYTLSTVSSTSGMAIFDSAKKLTYRDFDYTPSVDGKIRIKHRMSTGSHLQANVLMSAEFVNDNRVNKTLIINNDLVISRANPLSRAVLNLGCIHGKVKWDITLNNPTYRYAVRIYSRDIGYYCPYDYVYNSGWIYDHNIGSMCGEPYQYFQVSISRTDDGILTSTDIANIQSALSGSITYNNLSHLAKEPQKKNIINNRQLKVCAHRGFHLNDIPENSIDSMRFAAELGFDMAETDFSITSDGELVLMHDASINGTMVNADGTPISGTVNVIDKTLAELRENYVLASEDPRMMKPIPTLEEYFLACRNYGIFPLPEIKKSRNNAESVLKAYNLGCDIMGKDNFAFASSDYELLDYARTLSDKLLLVYSGRTLGEGIIGTVNSITGESRETPYTMWSSKYDIGITAALVKQYHDKGMKVLLWAPPVEDYDYIKELGADVAITNNIGPNIGNTIGYVFDSYATWNDFITDGVFDGQTLTLDTSQQLSCNLKETIVNGKFALEINFTGSITITAPNLSTTVTSSDADKTYIYQGVIDYKNPSLSITATAASMIKMIRYYVVPVNQ